MPLPKSFETRDLKAIENNFNNYFVNVGPKLAAKLPSHYNKLQNIFIF